MMAQEPWEVGRPWFDWLLGKFGMTNEEAGADMLLFYERAREVIRRPNKSGFRDVFAVVNKWQAKPYIKPGDQRSAGYFDTKEEAADEIIKYSVHGRAAADAKEGQAEERCRQAATAEAAEGSAAALLSHSFG